MSALFGSKTFLLIVTILVLGGLTAGFIGIEGSGHQQEMHHCVACCVNHHVAAPVLQTDTKPASPTATFSRIFSELLYNQVVLKPLAPPPKFLA